MSQPDLADQALEALSIHRRGARSPEVTVNDHHLLDSPTQRDCALLQRVLALGALGVLEHLAQRRLTHVQVRVPAEVPGLYLRIHFGSHAKTSLAWASVIAATMLTSICSMPDICTSVHDVMASESDEAVGEPAPGSPTQRIHAAMPFRTNTARPRTS